jgi:hypothetical protein
VAGFAAAEIRRSAFGGVAVRADALNELAQLIAASTQ